VWQRRLSRGARQSEKSWQSIEEGRERSVGLDY
jgi:hypothetical protein